MIQTVPALTGVHLELGGISGKTDSNGLAVFSKSSSGHDTLRIDSHKSLGQGRDAVFKLWSDGIHGAARRLGTAPFTYIQAGFDVYATVEHVFVDQRGKRVEPDVVDSCTISSSEGRTYECGDSHSRRLLARRVLPGGEGLISRPITYTPERVDIAGTNVVDGTQSQISADGRTWRIQVLTQPVRLEARDALLNTPIDSTVILQFPDGSRRRYSVNGEALTLEAVPGGGYLATTESPGLGWALSTPFTVEGPSRIRLMVLTLVDVVAVALVPVILVAAAVVSWIKARPRRGTRVALRA